MRLLISRDYSPLDETLGILSIDTKFFGYTLELPEGESKQEALKEGKMICIPKGEYLVRVTHSNAFNKRLPLIYNDIKTDQIITEQGTWAGVRFHGANTYLDLKACIGIAKTTHKNEASGFFSKTGKMIKNWIQGSLSDSLTKKLDDGEVHNLTIK